MDGEYDDGSAHLINVSKLTNHGSITKAQIILWLVLVCMYILLNHGRNHFEAIIFQRRILDDGVNEHKLGQLDGAITQTLDSQTRCCWLDGPDPC